jgi:hypothetical protein
LPLQFKQLHSTILVTFKFRHQLAVFELLCIRPLFLPSACHDQLVVGPGVIGDDRLGLLLLIPKGVAEVEIGRGEFRIEIDCRAVGDDRLGQMLLVS